MAFVHGGEKYPSKTATYRDLPKLVKDVLDLNKDNRFLDKTVSGSINFLEPFRFSNFGRKSKPPIPYVMGDS